ncbi:MAG: hypothetical protein IT289_13220 [Oligoflexia bacterium]|nr:hypothetical protein [Oligoflexia bacterium]
MGDVTSAGVKFFPWKMTDTEAVLVNAYDLLENPKCNAYRKRLEKEKKTIREHINFDGPLMIDSGAYYFLRQGNIKVDPIKILETENKSTADIGVILDHPFPPGAKDISRRIQRTLTNTQKMFEAYGDLKSPKFELLPVIHGHSKRTIDSTIQKLINLSDEYGFNLNKVGVGSLAPIAQNGNKELAVEVLTAVRRSLPDAYIHCFSMGSVLLMLLAFYCGVNTVDSQTWIMSAAFKYVQLPGHYVARLATREKEADPEGFKSRLNTMKKTILRLYSEEGFTLKDWGNGSLINNPNTSDLHHYLIGLMDTKKKNHVHDRACHNLWVFNFEVKRVREMIKLGKVDQFVESRLAGTKYFNAFLKARELLNLGLK